MIEGSLEVKLPTIWTDEKQSRAEAERREKIRREKSRRERVRRKKMQMREKVGKSRNTVFFPMICVSGRSRSRLAKAAGVEPVGQMRDEKLHAVVARSRFPSQNVYPTHHSRTTFGSWDVEKVHAVVARSTFPSQHVKNTRGFGPLLEVQMSKKSTLLWRGEHFEVKMFKTLGVRTTFGGSDVAWRGRRKGLCTLSKVSKTWGFCSIFNYNHHYTTLHSNALHSITLNYTTLHYTTLHSTTVHYITLHYLPLHYITLHYTTLHYTTLHYTTLHYTTLPSSTLHYITLHYTPQHYNYNYTTTLHYAPLHPTILNYTPLH